MSDKHYAYEQALKDGIFDTEDLPVNFVREIDNYESTVISLSKAYKALDARFTDDNFATEQLGIVDDMINNIVHEVRKLQEKFAENKASLGFDRADYQRSMKLEYAQ